PTTSKHRPTKMRCAKRATSNCQSNANCGNMRERELSWSLVPRANGKNGSKADISVSAFLLGFRLLRWPDDGAPNWPVAPMLKFTKNGDAPRDISDFKSRDRSLKRLIVDPVAVVHPRARQLGDRKHPLIVFEDPAE